MNRSSIILSILMWVSICSFSQWDPPKRTVDIKHSHLEITLDEKVGRVWGIATHKVTPLWRVMHLT